MKQHNWKLIEIKWPGTETIFVWDCHGCRLHHEVFAPSNVGEHAADSYKPPERKAENCEDVMVKLIMES